VSLGRTLTALFIDAGDVVLRKAHEHDREPLIEHVTDPDVRAHLGGPRSRHTAARHLDEAGVAAVTDAPGSFVIADKVTDAFLGTVSLTRRGVHHQRHVPPLGEELELSYTLDRPAWGRGLAYRAAVAVLRTAAAELPDEPVIVVTQTANVRSLNLARRLGFVPASTFTEFGAEQTLAVTNLHTHRPVRAT
jgi:RimJ/RimL family protein N-acetyltransferase